MEDESDRPKKSRRTLRVAQRLSPREISEGKKLSHPKGVHRPRTRGDCVEAKRPCPFVSCRHHLYIDVSASTGTLKLNHAVELVALGETCSLDVADDGPKSLGEVGELMNLTKERVRQIEERALEKVRGRYPFSGS